MSLFTWLFAKVIYSCTRCDAVQRIPLRRVHVFERFHGLIEGQPVLIACPQCQDGVQYPSSYRSHTGHFVAVDPQNPPSDAFVHGFY